MSQSISAYPIQPVSLNTVPTEREGSKGLPFAVNWSDANTVKLVNGISTFTINLLQQFQTGQFTNIQAVYIDNSTNWVDVNFTCLETGQSVRCPALSQGLFPLISNVAPVFTLTLSQGGTSGFTTKIFLLNTSQKHYVTTAGTSSLSPGLRGATSTSFTLTGPSQATFLGPVTTGNLWFRMFGFNLSINALGAAGAQTVFVALLQDGNAVWSDNFNAPAIGALSNWYSPPFVQFPLPLIGGIQVSTWALSMSATPAAGALVELNYYWDEITLS